MSNGLRPAALWMLRSALLFVGCGILAGAEPKPARIDFGRDIRPILSDKCFHCHGPDAETRSADLRLDDESDAKRLRDGYRILDVAKPLESELWLRISAKDDSERMPPPDSGKSLTAEEMTLLRRWIEQGAEWSQHWAFVTPVRAPVPEVQEARLAEHWIDRFILARLEAEGLTFSPEADRVTLLRRVTFDLTGLPPTPAEVAEFVNDRRPDAWERVVDRLLASEAFGERLASYWLDLVRFADTVGYHGDQDHHISPYRDYVIDAFNDNLPFDQFTREQLAGDLLPDSGIDQKIASGYNRLLQTSHEGGVQVKEYLAIYSADHVRNLSAVWMGGTLGCAQCHDHKYDPYTAKDFYAMAAFFADVDEDRHLRGGGRDTVPTVRAPEVKVLTRRERILLADLEQQIHEIEESLATPTGEGANVAELQQKKAALEARRTALQENARLTMITVAIEPRTIRILPRGNWLDESGPIVEPGIPEFLGTLKVEGRRANRLDLATWLTDPDKGVGLLTARVFANRFWYLFFGEGISRSLDDFGGQGEPPSHPELLDRLAHEFVESGWNLKHLVRQMVLSRTYRQVSTVSAALREHDPENRLFSRQARFRLPAEMIRDNALAISGLLVRQIGGASVKPYQPDGYYRHLNFPKRTYQYHTDERQWRRGVYVHWQRQFLHPMMKAFDAPSREECTAQRPRSNTPLESLTLLNDPTFVEAARVLAARILREGGESADSRLDFAYSLALSRTPDATERGILTDLLTASREEYTSDPESARALVGTGLAKAATGLDVSEHAAWTVVARTLLNLSETNTRN